MSKKIKLGANFYSKLKAITDFREISNKSFYKALPEGWCIFITDIVNSTNAIESGKYKEVNIAGSLSVMGLSNILHSMDFPFLFGGDGMTYLVPDEILHIVKGILSDTRDIIKKSFDLDLRVGMISTKELYERGETLTIAKFKVSRSYNQALIKGTAIDYAEKLIKSLDCPPRYKVPLDYRSPYKANLSGFTCRWKDIPSSKEETISYIIKFRDESHEDDFLHEVLDMIYDFFGTDKDYHPLKENKLELIDREQAMSSEAKIQSRRPSGFFFNFSKKMIRIQVALLRTVLKLGISVKAGKKNFKNARMDNIISSDFRKFDGTLKMVVSCNKNERLQFQNKLENYYRTGKIYYGIHVADKALMTCYIQLSTDSEVHFIDAANGGYAMAAKHMKKQIHG